MNVDDVGQDDQVTSQMILIIRNKKIKVTLLNLAGCCTGLMVAVGHWVGQGTLGLRKEYLNSNINVNVREIIYWRRIFRFKYVRTKKEMMMIIRLCVFESDLEVPRVPATQATLSPFQDGAGW